MGKLSILLSRNEHCRRVRLGLAYLTQDTPAYTVVHSCKPYIQPNQPWPDPSYTRAIRVYRESRTRFLKLKKPGTGVTFVCDRIYKRSYKTVRERV